jgi:hypothetical protein
LFFDLAEIAAPESLPVAIERGYGLVVDQIVGAGHPVLMVDSAGFKAARSQWGSAGANSEVGDACMLADYARTDGHRMRRMQPVEHPTRDLGALVRTRSALVEARTAASNQFGRWSPNVGLARPACSGS